MVLLYLQHTSISVWLKFLIPLEYLRYDGFRRFFTVSAFILFVFPTVIFLAHKILFSNLEIIL